MHEDTTHRTTHETADDPPEEHRERRADGGTPGEGARDGDAGDGDRDREEEFAVERDRMVDRLVSRDVVEPGPVADALRTVPRHEFVPPDRRDAAYRDRPLPIGNGQTISAPHMVGMMLDLLALEPGERVLEIGTGCGYHAAVAAEVVGPEGMYSVEYDGELAERARERLDHLGYDVAVRVGDGREGWAEHAPYDAAYLTCAPTSVPDAVVKQTRPGGCVLAPVGSGRQTLVRLRRRADGAVERETHGGVRFVPMQGDADE